jgi:hypothetical protein
MFVSIEHRYETRRLTSAERNADRNIGPITVPSCSGLPIVA